MSEAGSRWPAPVELALGLVIGWWALTIAPVEAWWIDLLRHFVPQSAIVAWVLMGWAAWRQRSRAAVFAGLLALVQTARSIGEGTLAPGGERLVVLSWNVRRDQPTHGPVVEALSGAQPTLLCALETHAGWVEALAAAPGFRVVHDASRPDYFGAALLSAEPELSLRAPARAVLPGGNLVEVPLRVRDRELDVLLVHTMPPVGSDATALRDAQLREVGRWTASRPTPWVVCGDLNATYWSTPMRALGVPRVQGAWWPLGSWPSWLPSWLGIPIDHVLVSPELVVARRTLGASAGSDHRLVTVELAWQR
jgi:endonuclease/exonuclease/phosphatase (EEP) superfamily protein YafD